MAVLGISGLFTTESNDYDPATFGKFGHDAAACVVQDGEIIAAVEEERLSRDKHTFRFPSRAIQACLDLADVAPDEITDIAHYFAEDYQAVDMARIALDDPGLTVMSPREQLRQCASESVGYEFRSDTICFVPHHEAHAASAFFDSDMSDALILVSDHNGEAGGLSIYTGDDAGLTLLHTQPRIDSLGFFYTAITKLIGYQNHDEYKVMGLSSFGDPSVYRPVLDEFYTLTDGGCYSMPVDNLIASLLRRGWRPRRRDEPITQAHKDLAASAQEVLERVSLHVISGWLQRTGRRRLCMAGGVAQNTSLNGKLLNLPDLDSVYIPHAAHDGGAALGAAMIAEQRRSGSRADHRKYSRTAYLGPSIGSTSSLKATLDQWSGFVTYERVDGIEEAAAECLARNEVIAWVQGRSEFGPRALGNRSILADPRPAENRERVNRLIKKREDYRPFAPVVAACSANKFFDLGSATAEHQFMGFVVPVRDPYRTELAAITHVDGTARVQILHEAANPRYWKLVKDFERRTGVPVLLNTSFNNSSEPIVQSAEDALATFVSTGLDRLAIGDYLVSRVAEPFNALMTTRLEMMPFCTLARRTSRLAGSITLYRTAVPNRRHEVTEQLATLIETGKTIADLSLSEGMSSELVNEIWEMWDRRLIRIVP